LIWVSQPGEASFYRWQARFTFAPDDHIDSPAEIWTEPHVSSSANLDLYPEILTPKHGIELQLGQGWDPPVDSIDLTAVARDDQGTQIATRVLRIAPGSASATWAVRRAATVRMRLEGAMEAHFPGGGNLNLPSRILLDPQVIANSPFVRPVSIAPLVV